MSKWTKRALGEISNLCLGKMLDKEKNKGSFQPYLANLNVRWGDFSLDNLQQMRFEEDEQERYGLAYGDLVICEGGEPGRCAIWRDQVPNMKIQKALHRLRVKKGHSAEFLYYRMLLAGRSGELNKHFIGSTIKHLTGVVLKQVEFDFPNENEQLKIATALRSLDEKIELNNRINAELEAMAKTLYDYWFVQFDFPDADGKPYKTSGGKMVYNPTLKREIPEGWNNAILGSYIKLQRGVTYGKEDVLDQNNKEAIGVLRATNITANTVDTDDLVYVPKSLVNDSQKLNPLDTIIVMSSGSKEHIGKNGIYYFNEPRGFGAFCSKVVPRDGAVFFVNTFLQSIWFKTYIKNQCLGTNINNLTGEHILKCNIVSPPIRVLKAFEEKIEPFYNKISINTQENQFLKSLRDWLLPMLMNGQVRVK